MSEFQGVALVASPQMDDPRFNQTVVLLLRHNEEGAMGVVLNRPIGEDQKVALAEIQMPGDTPLNFHFGGPVAGPVIVLQTRESRLGNKLGKMFTINKKEQIEGVLNNAEDCRLFVGHATWEPGQLEDEVEEGLWLTVPVSGDLLFGDHDEIWADAVRSVGRSFYRDVLGIRGEPADVSWN